MQAKISITQILYKKKNVSIRLIAKARLRDVTEKNATNRMKVASARVCTIPALNYRTQRGVILRFVHSREIRM